MVRRAMPVPMQEVLRDRIQHYGLSKAAADACVSEMAFARAALGETIQAKVWDEIVLAYFK